MLPSKAAAFILPSAPKPGWAYNLPMSKKPDVAILGAGVVGQTLALLLARERLKVALVAPPTPPAGKPPDIRAYAINQASRQLLTDLRAWPEPTSPATITPVHGMWVAEPAADMPAALRFAAPSSSTPVAWIADVAALETALAQAVRFQPGIEVVQQVPPRVDLTVVCEGRRSTTRDAMGFTYERQPYAHTALAARLHCERPHGAVARQWFLNGDILALLPLEGDQGQSVALVWSMAHARAAQHLALPPMAFAQAVAQACDHALGAMELQGEPASWPLELARATHWVQPGVALAGDAAHAMHPLAGQGLNAGLADVATLAQVLQAREYWRPLGDIKLLRRYERARQADLRAMQWVTDHLYGLFNQADPRLQALRRWGLRGFDRLAPLKRWAMQQAMGQPLA